MLPAAARHAWVMGRHGQFLVDPNDRLIGRSLQRYGEYSEHATATLCRLCKPGHRVLEIGANIGQHTLALARQVGPRGRVIALEPRPGAFGLLSANLVLNGIDNVDALPYAASDADHRPRGASPDKGHPASADQAQADSQTAGPMVPAITVDLLLERQAVELIKIDCGGLEREAVAGAAGTLARHRPLLYVANDLRERSADLIRTLFGFRYQLFWHVVPLFNPGNHANDPADIFPGRVSINMLGIPAERGVAGPAMPAIENPGEYPPEHVVQGENDGPAEDSGTTDARLHANALRRAGHSGAAVAWLERAVARQPDDARSWFDLALARRHSLRYADALAAAETAARLEPDQVDHWHLVGLLQLQLGQLDASGTTLTHAAAMAPDSASVAFTLATVQLETGQWQAGWQGYEQRLALADRPLQPLPGRPWDGTEGTDGGKRTLLVYADQGLGDTLQFSRFLSKLAARWDGPLVVECREPLRRLFEDSFGVLGKVVSGVEASAEIDLRIPLSSLPYHLGVSGEDLVTNLPYLLAPRAPMTLPGAGEGLRVGLTWRGSQKVAERSCPFDEFQALLEVPGVSFYSLQRGIGAGDMIGHGCDGLVHDLAPRLEDFADDAMVLHQLDLLITIDTALCHLAGGLNLPTWTLLPYASDWRWHRGCDDSPWYPSMRCFRQPGPGDWRGVIAEVKRSLSALALSRSAAT